MIIVELPIVLASADVVLTQTESTKTVSLTIMNDGERGNREVTLRLEYAGPSRFSDLVRISDGGTSTHDEIVITIIDDDDCKFLAGHVCMNL